MRTWIDSWPVIRQLTGDDPLGRGISARHGGGMVDKRARTQDADTVT